MTRKIRRKRHVTKTWKKLRQTGGFTFSSVATVIQFLTRIRPLRRKYNEAVLAADRAVDAANLVASEVSAASAASAASAPDLDVLIKHFNELDLNVNTSELVLINTTDRLAKGLNNIFGTQSWNLTYIPAAIEAQPDYDTKIETKDSLSLEEELIVFEKPPTEPAQPPAQQAAQQPDQQAAQQPDQQNMDTKISHLIKKWENIDVEFYKMVTDYNIDLVRQPTLQTMGSRTLPFQMLNIGDVVAATIVRERMDLVPARYPHMTTNVIDNIINNFKKKMRVSVGTQLAIAYAVKNFVPPDPPVPPGPQPRPPPGPQPVHPFQYLENLIGLLKHAVHIINNTFDNIWDQKKTSDQFLVSGGNVFFLLAGVLDWLDSRLVVGRPPDDIIEENLTNLSAIGRKIQDKLNTVELEELRRFIGEHRALIRSILSSLSDMDFVFLTLNKNYMNWKSVPMKSVIEITGQLLRTIMNTGNQLFPFIKQNDHSPQIIPLNERAKGRTYNNSSSLDTRKLRGMVLDGLRQTCSDIEELRISLHRIKQQIHIVGLHGLGGRTELVFGEGIDLVIASKDTPIFPYKQRAYEKVWLLEKTPRGYYSTDVFLHELDEILKSPKDGKTAKRTQRRDFLNMLRSPNPNAADIILWAIFEHIHE